MGFKRSTERMAQIETRLRAGMAARGIAGATADEIVRGITSFALYGFPESHAASFALLAYASAYLKAHHPAAFYCALLNNWPMGFYHPATLVKDAQRHGVAFLPIDVMHSAWRCTIEAGGLRLGLRYVSGLREAAGRRIEEERARASFASLGDLVARAGLQEDERRRLANAGACAALWRASSRRALAARRARARSDDALRVRSLATTNDHGADALAPPADVAARGDLDRLREHGAHDRVRT